MRYNFVHLTFRQARILHQHNVTRVQAAAAEHHERALLLHPTWRTLSTGNSVFLNRSRHSSSNLARVSFSLKSFPPLKSAISTVASTWGGR